MALNEKECSLYILRQLKKIAPFRAISQSKFLALVANAFLR